MIPIVNSKGHLQGWWSGRYQHYGPTSNVVKIDLMEHTVSDATMGGDRDPMTATVSFVQFKLVHVDICGDPTGLTGFNYLVADKIPKKFWKLRDAVQMDSLTFS